VARNDQETVKRTEAQQLPGKVAVTAFDHNFPGDLESLEDMRDRFCGQETIVKFDEGTGPRQHGNFSVVGFRLMDATQLRILPNQNPAI